MLVLAVIAMLGTSACTAVQTIPKDDGSKNEAYLTLAVEPESAELYVDGTYKGRAGDWVDKTVPIEPGERRIKVVADGYVTRRFDVAFEPGERKTLNLEMERQLDDLEPGDVGSRR
ncbi:MAG: PEGA domain-containing protein [Bradymonadaceae bacterium]